MHSNPLERTYGVRGRQMLPSPSSLLIESTTPQNQMADTCFPSLLCGKNTVMCYFWSVRLDGKPAGSLWERFPTQTKREGQAEAPPSSFLCSGHCPERM